MLTALLPLLLQLLQSAPDIVADVEGAISALEPEAQKAVIGGVSHLAGGVIAHLTTQAHLQPKPVVSEVERPVVSEQQTAPTENAAPGVVASPSPMPSAQGAAGPANKA